MDADLAPTDSETESDEEVLGINAGDQDEGQAGPNPGVKDEESQPQSSHVVHAGPNLEHMDLEATDASTQQNTEQIDEEFTITAYLNVQENLKLPTEDQMILEDHTSSTRTLSSMQNLDKELNFTNQFLEEKPQEDEPEKTNTESEVQSMVTVPIHQDTSSVIPMATPVIDLTISHPVSITVHAPLPTSTVTTTTITTTTSLPPLPPQPQQSSSNLILLQRIGELKQHIADLIQSNLALEESMLIEVMMQVDWAMQAPLRARFSDLPAFDMKEPPPPPPPAGASGAPGTSRASGSSQLLLPLPPPSTGTSDQTATTYVSAAHESSPTDSLMNEDSIPKEQASTLVSTYEPPAKNLLLAKIGDMTTFMNWYCSKVNKTVLTQVDFKGQTYEVVKAFYPDVIHMQF
ncbi:hypothetical protein Tco_1125423 [Tanacetum coccineum]|uniref:Uncharacterized protein n=1 Tax=Tanacetum coccineum TaxID=301880 RepID=A0ABQ5J951_9ASTR